MTATIGLTLEILIKELKSTVKVAMTGSQEDTKVTLAQRTQNIFMEVVAMIPSG